MDVFQSCKNGTINNIRNFINNGGNINIKNNDNGNNCTLLHIASSYNQLEIVKLLIENGSNCNLIDSNNNYPIDDAYNNGNYEIIKYLYDKTNNYDYFKIMKITFEINDLKMTKYIVKHHPDIIDNIDEYGNGILHNVIMITDEIDIIKYFINETNIDFDFENRYGITPLEYAADYNKIEFMKLLIENGAHKIFQDSNYSQEINNLLEHNFYYNIFDYCILDNKKKIYSYIKHGCENNDLISNVTGERLIDTINELGYLDLVKYMIEHNKIPYNNMNCNEIISNAFTSKNNKLIEFYIERINEMYSYCDGETFLSLAIKNKCDIIFINRLLNLDYKVRDKKFDFEYSLYISAKYDNLDVIKLILDSGAERIEISDEFSQEAKEILLTY